MKNLRIQAIVFALGVCLAASGCAAASAVPTQAVEVSATVTGALPTALPSSTIPALPSPTPLPSGTATPAPSATAAPSPLPSATALPTPTATEAASPTPGRANSTPGTYNVGRCVRVTVRSHTYDLCVLSVTIRADLKMQWNMSWTLHLTQLDAARKLPDTNNKDMFLTDDEGNRYDHTEVGGCAAESLVMKDGDSCQGWFIFPRASNTASEFTFSDNDNGAGAEIQLIRLKK